MGNEEDPAPIKPCLATAISGAPSAYVSEKTVTNCPAMDSDVSNSPAISGRIPATTMSSVPMANDVVKSAINQSGNMTRT